ncbi:MAG TPA: cytochrome B [Idiomarina sp.]|nr:cytochrome B [Idiomarina sp.]
MQIWDIGIRLFHWSIALAFVLNYFLLEPGETAHQIAGYYAFAWLIFRVVWGFLGPQRARFSDFFPTPSRIKTHITQLKQRQLPRDAGHNPLGGVVILLMMVLLAYQATTGFMLEEVDAFYGSSMLEDLHELGAHTLFALVCLHIIAVIFVQWWGRIQLIRPMITGRRD